MRIFNFNAHETACAKQGFFQNESTRQQTIVVREKYFIPCRPGFVFWIRFDGCNAFAGQSPDSFRMGGAVAVAFAARPVVAVFARAFFIQKTARMFGESCAVGPVLRNGCFSFFKRRAP